MCGSLGLVLTQCGRGPDRSLHRPGSPGPARERPRLRGRLRSGGGAAQREDVHGAEPGERAGAFGRSYKLTLAPVE